jgi:threonine aldolase
MGIKVVNQVQTNMVYIDYTPIGWKDADWNNATKKIGWKSEGHSGGTRLCTHYGIEREDIKAFVDGLAKQMK